MKKQVSGLLGALAFTACSESERPQPEKPGETCFAVANVGYGTDDCPAQACFPETIDIVDHDPTGDGLTCFGATDFCPAPPDTSYAEFVYVGEDYSLVLSLDRRIVTEGYSLENFRKYLFNVTVAPVLDEGFWGRTGDDELSTFEVVSYQNGVIHVTVEGTITQTQNTFDVPTYFCPDRPGSVATCTRRQCGYRSGSQTGGKGDSIVVTGDFELPIQQPAP
jgi:hypothetical protein